MEHKVKAGPARFIIGHIPVVLATVYDENNKRPTATTVQWCMPISDNSVCLSMLKCGNTSTIVREHKKFVLNIPRASQAQAVLALGQNSGRDADKFQMDKVKGVFTCDPKTLIIPECVAHLTCAVEQVIPTPDDFTVLYLARVTETLVDSVVFDTKRIQYNVEKTFGAVGIDPETGKEVMDPKTKEALSKMTLSSLSDTEFYANGARLTVFGAVPLNQ